MKELVSLICYKDGILYYLFGGKIIPFFTELNPRVKEWIRRRTKIRDNCRHYIEIVSGKKKPIIIGHGPYYTTPKGDIVRYPSAYRRKFGRPIYHQSNRTIVVGMDYLTKDIRRILCKNLN